MTPLNMVFNYVSKGCGLEGAQRLLDDLQAVESGFEDFEEQKLHVSGKVYTYTVNEVPTITIDCKDGTVRVHFPSCYDNLSDTTETTTFTIKQATVEYVD